MDQKVVYKGETLQGVRHGQGQYNYPGGVFQYSGPWDQGVKHGKQGRFSMPGYFEHVGDFVDGQMTGRGRREWVDGRTYEGDWVNGEMQGKGAWANTASDETYDGDFVANQRHGHGTLKLSNGDIYDGDFQRHRYHGRGAYLKEKNFVVDGHFEDGCVHGTAKATWHKKGFYEGSWSRGRIAGPLGQFSAADGSYQYIGPFANSAPALRPSGILARCDRTTVPPGEGGGGDKGKKEGKKPAAKGKDAAADLSASTATVPQGTMIGAIHIALSAAVEPVADMPPPVSSDAPVAGPVEGVAFARVPLPLAELRRRVAVRLRPYVPPPAAPEPAKGAKGKPAEPAPAAPVSEGPPPPPVPLWVRQPSLGSAAEAWSRLPPGCLKVVRGLCGRAEVTARLMKVTQPEEESAAPAPAAAEYADGPHGVCSTSIDSGVSLAVTLPTSALLSKFRSLPMPEEVAVCSVVVDFCLDTAFYEKMDIPEGGATVTIPVLCAKSTPSDAELALGRERCALSLSLSVRLERGAPAEPPTEPPAEGVEGPAASPANEIGWSDGVWELRCGGYRHSWGGGLSAPESWHSLGLSVKHSSRASDGETVHLAGIDLVLDGAHRRKAEDSGAALADVVTRWLHSLGLHGAQPEPEPVPVMDPDGDEAAETKEEPEPNEAAPAAPASGDLKLAIGGTSNEADGGAFVGSVAVLAVCNRDDLCDVVESTSCFADWVRERLSLLQSAEDAAAAVVGSAAAEGAAAQGGGEGGGEPPVEPSPIAGPVLPPDCVETLVATVVCRGGYAVCEGLVVPLSTPEGMYVLEISDDVDPACREPEPAEENSPAEGAPADAPETEEGVEEAISARQAEQLPVRPQDTAALCEMAPRLKPNTSILVAVVAPPA